MKITNAQVGIGNATPNLGSILDLTNSNDKALILPTSTPIPTSVGTFTVSGMMMYFNDKIFHPSFYTLSPILGVCLIIWFVNKNNFIYKVLSSKLFVGTGLISYSLYLWHYPIFAYLRYLEIFNNSILIKILAIILTITLSIISYHFIEKPFRKNIISLKKLILYILISVTILLLLFLSVGSAYKKRGVTSAPKGLQSFMEPIILFVRDEVAKPNIGKKYAKYMPFLLTIFFLILVNNFLGLIPFFPGAANVSGNIAFTMTLAVFVFILVNINGNKSYWQHIFWMPGMHWSLKLFLAPIELIGVFTKPISLMIRLFANITAGHILVLSLICLIFIFKTIFASAIAVPFAVFIGLIELLVAFLQAYIFTMLSAMYIVMATEEHHHEEAHH